MSFVKAIPVAILGVGVLLISGVRSQQVVPPRAPMRTIPSTIAGYSSRDQVVSADERAVAGMSDYVLRIFGADSSFAFTVYVGYYDRQVQGKSIHSPKNCLPGAGWEILENGRVALRGATNASLGSGNRVVLANGSARALVYYWYQGRGRIEPSEYRVKWDLLRDAARYGRTEEALVRIVIPLERAAKSAMPTAAQLARGDSLAAQVIGPLVPAVYHAMPTFPGA